MKGEISGDIHFDDDENWTLGSYAGINLTQVVNIMAQVQTLRILFLLKKLSKKKGCRHFKFFL